MNKKFKPTAPKQYQGNQVIINSDRLLFNAKNDCVLVFAKQAMSFSTNGSIHFDCGPNMATNPNNPNGPKIPNANSEFIVNANKTASEYSKGDKTEIIFGTAFIDNAFSLNYQAQLLLQLYPKPACLKFH